MKLAKGQSLRGAAVYLLQIVVGLVFLRVGVGQILGQPAFASVFDNFDSGAVLRVLIGGLEVLGGALLLTRTQSAYAASALAALMLLAGILGMGNSTDSLWLWSGRITGGIPLAPNLLLIACLCIAWWRRDQFRRLSAWL